MCESNNSASLNSIELESFIIEKKNIQLINLNKILLFLQQLRNSLNMKTSQKQFTLLYKLEHQLQEKFLNIIKNFAVILRIPHTIRCLVILHALLYIVYTYKYKIIHKFMITIIKNFSYSFISQEISSSLSQNELKA
ncbi:hypothetical protein ACKWTF_007741 [Chironomus riparius]